MVKVHDSEEVANHAGPESCGAHREVTLPRFLGHPDKRFNIAIRGK
jgi:hypothetical protein